MKKRILSALLACCVLFALTACSSQPANGPASDTTQAPANGEASNAAQDNGVLNPIGELPLVKEGKTVEMTMFIGGIGAQVSSYDYSDNDFTKKVVDETGIKLDFIATTAQAQKEKLNILLNSGDYPDLIRDNRILTKSDMDYYAKQGIFIPLDDYGLADYPNIKAAFDEYPEIMDVITGSDGKIYAFPEVNDAQHSRFANGRFWYYMPFIRDNGRSVPQTTEELKEYLIYVRDNDLNGNGKKDEVPIAFDQANIENFIAAVAKSYLPFVFDSENWGLALEDGKIIEQYRSEEFRNALRFMHELYEENLILKDSFTMSRDQLIALGESPDGPTIAVGYTIQSNHLVKKAGESHRWYEYFLFPPVEGPTGARYAGDKGPWSIFQRGMFVTSKCPEPQAAVALYDYLVGFEVSMDGYIGPKGECWDDADPGAKSLRGDDARYKLLTTFGAQRENAGWNQANPMIRNPDFRLGEQATDYETAAEYLKTGDAALMEQLLDNASYNEICNYITSSEGSHPYALPEDIFIPPLALDEMDSSRIADINAVFKPWRLQTYVEFITGARDIETEWDAYLAEMDGMSTPEMVDIMQKAYDAQK